MHAAIDAVEVVVGHASDQRTVTLNTDASSAAEIAEFVRAPRHPSNNGIAGHDHSAPPILYIMSEDIHCTISELVAILTFPEAQ